jgi:hypothetical protein
MSTHEFSDIYTCHNHAGHGLSFLKIQKAGTGIYKDDSDLKTRLSMR